MKKITIVVFLLISVISTAQSTYEKTMTKAIELWENKKTKEATALFERVSKVDTKEWLPPYYVAQLEILSCFGLKEESTLNAKLEKAQVFLDLANTTSVNNPEIIITQALLNTAYIAFDGQKYGRMLFMKNSQLYAKALKIAPKNPRVVLAKAEWDMGMAQFFKKPTTIYCKDIERALVLFEQEKTPKLYPKYGKQRAKAILKKCGK